MTHVELIAAVEAAVTRGVSQAIIELRKEDATRVQSAVQLAESMRSHLADCQAELKALRSDARSLTHEVINARSSTDTWRDVAQRRETQAEELRAELAEMAAEVAALKRDKK